MSFNRLATALDQASNGGPPGIPSDGVGDHIDSAVGLLGYDRLKIFGIAVDGFQPLALRSVAIEIVIVAVLLLTARQLASASKDRTESYR